VQVLAGTRRLSSEGGACRQRRDDALNRQYPQPMNAELSTDEDGAGLQPDWPATAEDLASDLSLLVMYLSSWKEGRDRALRFWKGFSFEVLNQLADQGLISDNRRAKSAVLTDAGVRRARELLRHYSPGTAVPWAASTD
jgi:hypothetical protein